MTAPCLRFVDDFGNDMFPYQLPYQTYMARYFFLKGNDMEQVSKTIVAGAAPAPSRKNVSSGEDVFYDVPWDDDTDAAWNQHEADTSPHSLKELA